MKVKDMVIADWAIGLRSIDPMVVSRYRHAWRTGAKFPPVIIDKATKEVISGNHRVSAALQELGEDAEIPFVLQSFKTQADRLKTMAEENSRHGMPMDGFTRRKLACAMVSEGMSTQQVAEVFNVPVNAVENWGGQTVFVIGKGAVPVKHGIDTNLVAKMKVAEYAEHSRKDYGVTAKHMLLQLTRWLVNGWVDRDKLEDEIEALKKVL